MIDTLLKHESRFLKPVIWDHANLTNQNYFVLTLHRPANVDGEIKLKNLLETIINGVRGLPIVFPVHPRTAKNLNSIGIRCGKSIYDRSYVLFRI
jgi:UDP-N-acetylglucosamine 2-epimerase (non-hydrolysing)